MKEWCAFHHALGFEKIFLFDDNSDDPSLKITATRLHMVGAIDIYDACKTGITGTLQLDAYDMGLRMAREQGFDWILPLDLDEFLYLPKHRTVQELINDLPDVITQVNFNWRIYGSSGHKFIEKDKLVIERFTKCSEPHFERNLLCKSLAKVTPEQSLHLHIHGDKTNCVNGDGESSIFIGRDAVGEYADTYGQINHYCIKSVEDFLEKRTRGYPEHSWHSNMPIPNSYFEINDRNEVEGVCMKDMIERTKETLRTWAI